MVEIMDERFSKRSVEHVRYVINNLLHSVIVGTETPQKEEAATLV